MLDDDIIIKNGTHRFLDFETIKKLCNIVLNKNGKYS